MARLECRTLDSLPSELIAHIASYSSAESVLALAQVSRFLHQTCYDSLLFLDTFRNGQWARHRFGSLTSNVELIARYAVAEARYLRFLEMVNSLDAQETEVQSMLSELVCYLPHLALLDNDVPALDRNFLLGQRLAPQIAFTVRTELSSKLAGLAAKRPVVCLTSAQGMMRAAPLMPSLSNVERELHDHNSITWCAYKDLSDFIRFRTPTLLDNFRYDNLLGVGKTATLLACAYPDPVAYPNLSPTFRTGGQRHPAHVDVPLVSKVSLATSPVDLPWPFSPTECTWETWGKWLRRQQSAQSTPAYLDDGEWVGRYMYHDLFARGTFTTRFDPPMIGIQFETRALLPSVRGTYSTATGADGVGEFELKLSGDGNGYFRARKAYKHQPLSWTWYLTSTPFGLYGLWTSEGAASDVGRLGGAVWLWKRAWCE